MTLFTGSFESISCIIVAPTHECLAGINVLYVRASCFTVPKDILLIRNIYPYRNAKLPPYSLLGGPT